MVRLQVQDGGGGGGEDFTSIVLKQGLIETRFCVCKVKEEER